jgi:hypothetical protein
MIIANTMMITTHHTWTAMAAPPRTTVIPASSFSSRKMTANTAKTMASRASETAAVEIACSQVVPAGRCSFVSRDLISSRLMRRITCSLSFLVAASVT